MRLSVRLRNKMLKHVHYITDAAGERLAAILPLDRYRELLQAMQVIPINEQRDDAPHRGVSDILLELTAKGEID